jgi:hypothetical protein
MSAIIFMRSTHLASGRLLAFKRMPSGEHLLLVNGKIRAKCAAKLAQTSTLPWRMAQVFNRMQRRAEIDARMFKQRDLAS